MFRRPRRLKKATVIGPEQTSFSAPACKPSFHQSFMVPTDPEKARKMMGNIHVLKLDIGPENS